MEIFVSVFEEEQDKLKDIEAALKEQFQTATILPGVIRRPKP